MCAYSSSVWVSGPILYLPFSLPYCIAKESQIVLQIAGDSILLAAGSWKQSEASLRFTCFKHKDTRGPEMCWLWKERKRAESFNGFKSGSGIETYPSAKSLKAKARDKFVSWIFLKNDSFLCKSLKLKENCHVFCSVYVITVEKMSQACQRYRLAHAECD